MRLLTILLLVHFSFPLLAKAVRFEIKDVNQRNQIDFAVEGLLERTVGTSHFISGWIEIDLEAVGDGIAGELEIDTRTFETGSELKNLFVRDKILDVGQFQQVSASFNKLISISKGRLINGETLTAKVNTEIKVKGISKFQVIPLKLVYFKEGELSKQRLPGNLLKLTTSFEFDPAIWNISLPSTIGGLVSKTMQVNAHVVGSDRLSVGLSGIPEGAKPKEVLPKVP